MMRKNFLILAAAAAGAFLGGMSPQAAKADLLYSFNFQTASFTTSGLISTDLAGDITGIVGNVAPATAPPVTANTGAISGLITAPGTPSAQGTYISPTTGQAWNYDDVLFPSGPTFVDNNGILFGFGANNIGNVYSTGPGSYFFSVDDPTALYNPGDLILSGGFTADGTIAGAVPEASTWIMMLLGFAGVGFFGYRRKATPAFRLV